MDESPDDYHIRGLFQSIDIVPEGFLSGGQRQRMEIARFLPFASPSFLQKAAGTIS